MGEFQVLRDLGYVLGGAALLLLAARPLRVPTILTYMMAGLVLGPATRLLTVSESIDLFSELGVALLLFVVGLELSLEKIRDIGRVAVGAGVVQVGVTFGLGFALGRLFGFAPTPAVFVGLTAAFSSTVVVVKLLDRADALDTLQGRMSIGILLVQDVLVAVVLTLVGGLADGPGEGAGPWMSLGIAFLGIAGLSVAGALAVRWVVQPVFSWLSESTEGLFIASLVWAFAFILAAEALHVSVELGAFLAGVLLAQLRYNHELRRLVHPLVNFFLAVFFVALGAQLEPTNMLDHWPLAVALSALVLLAKPALTAFVLVRMGQPRRPSVLAGITLGQVSEFSFIVVGLAIGAGLVDESFLGLVGLVGLVTIGASAVLVPRADDLLDRLPDGWVTAPARGPGSGVSLAAALEAGGGVPRAGHVVVAGMNTLGRLLVHAFAERGESVVAVDTDPAKLTGLPATTLVGSIDDSRLLREAGVPRAKLMVSALQIEDVNSLLAYRCRRMGVPVSIHAFESSLVFELLEIGADHLMISKQDGIGPMEAALRRSGALD